MAFSGDYGQRGAVLVQARRSLPRGLFPWRASGSRSGPTILSPHRPDGGSSRAEHAAAEARRMAQLAAERPSKSLVRKLPSKALRRRTSAPIKRPGGSGVVPSVKTEEGAQGGGGATQPPPAKRQRLNRDGSAISALAESVDADLEEFERQDRLRSVASDNGAPSASGLELDSSASGLAPKLQLPDDPLAGLTEIPTPAEAVLLQARSEFPVEFFRWTLPPVLLRSQVQGALLDRTGTSRDLAELCQRCVVRQFAIPSAIDTISLSRRGGDAESGFLNLHMSGSKKKLKRSHSSAHGDDYFIMFCVDYRALMERQRLLLEKSSQRDLSATFHRFQSCVLDKWFDISISRGEMERLLAAGLEVEDEDQPDLVNKSTIEADIKALVRAGLLLISSSTRPSAQVYWFAIPGVGSFVQSLLAGRHDLIEQLKREPLRQMTESRLLRRKVKGSKLGMEYHIRDAMGRGLVERFGIGGPEHELIRLIEKI